MTCDSFADGRAASDRLEMSRKYLQGDWSDTERSDWAKQLNTAKEYSNWEQLAIPKPEHLDAALTMLPAGSWYLQFTFTLATPYLSKGIEAFDLLDNPIVRDKVYEVPIVPAASWKGGLRAAALMHLLGDQAPDKKTLETLARDARMCRLFGNPKGAADQFQAGRLHCFPTGFRKTTCEVINPHDRARRVGKNPILLECVPAGETGTFTALYVPFGKRTDGDAAEDLAFCAQAIQDLLLQWGIGAKKSNGNGLAKGVVQGCIAIMKNQSRPESPQFPDITRRYLDKDGDEAFKLSKKEWREAHKATGAEAEHYALARNAYRKYQDDRGNFSKQLQDWQSTQGRVLIHDPITTLPHLVIAAQSGNVATALKEN